MKKYIVEVTDSGDVVWYNEAHQRHREEGPAVECADGSRYWWVNDEVHREDGPAMEFPDGTKEWWVNDKHHRIDGPAIESPDGYREWYLDGVSYTKEQFLKLTPFKFEKKTIIEKNDDGDIFYKNEFGEFHREDGPALEYADGTCMWCINDVYHREDGPAVMWIDGEREWYINGKEYTEKEFLARTTKKELTVTAIESLLGYSIKIIKG